MVSSYVDGPPGDYVAPQSVAVATVSGEVLAATPRRLCAIIVNSGSVNVHLSVGTDAVAGAGILLTPNGVAQIGGPAGLPLSNSAINAIVASGAGSLSVQDIHRLGP